MSEFGGLWKHEKAQHALSSGRVFNKPVVCGQGRTEGEEEEEEEQEEDTEVGLHVTPTSVSFTRQPVSLFNSNPACSPLVHTRTHTHTHTRVTHNAE